MYANASKICVSYEFYQLDADRNSKDNYETWRIQVEALLAKNDT